jgi:hypothetical protein
VKVGDTLYRNGLGLDTVRSIESKDVPADTPVFNFHVDAHENYYAAGYLVHNKQTEVPTTAGKQPEPPSVPSIPSAVLGKLSPDQTVEHRLTQLLSQKTPYTQAALRDALAASLRRGLQSSSLSLSAGLAGTLETLFPIASQDAGSSLAILQQNLTAQNNSILTEYTTQTNFKLTTYGYEMDAWNKAKQRDHESSEAFKARTWQEKQNDLDRTLKAQLKEMDVEVGMAGIKASSDASVTACRSRAMEIYINSVNSYQDQLRKGQLSKEGYNKYVGDAAKLRDQMMRTCTG